MITIAPSTYHDADPANGESGRRLAALFVRLVTSLPDVSAVCDLGCGNGYLAGLLGSAGHEIVGVDASQSGIAIARKTYGTSARFFHANIDVRLATTLGHRFDAVVSSDVIEHLYRPRELMRCAATLLRPGGWLVVGTPYHGYLKNLVLGIVNGWDAHHGVDWDGGHIKFFSVGTLSRLLEEEGFSVSRFAYHGRVAWLWKNMICIAKKVD